MNYTYTFTGEVDYFVTEMSEAGLVNIADGLACIDIFAFDNPAAEGNKKFTVQLVDTFLPLFTDTRDLERHRKLVRIEPSTVTILILDNQGVYTNSYYHKTSTLRQVLPSIYATTGSASHKYNIVYFLCSLQSIPPGLSTVERLSASQRVCYERLHCIYMLILLNYDLMHLFKL